MSTLTAILEPQDELAENSVVCLKHDLSSAGLAKGARGNIVHVYEGGAGYEVEFVTAGHPAKLVTVESSDIEPS